MKLSSTIAVGVLASVMSISTLSAEAWPEQSVTGPGSESVTSKRPSVRYRTVDVDGLEIFYREAGSPSSPTVVLLHGFPTSSHMFRNLIPVLAQHYHVIAPDYPGFGQSSMPSVDEFEYTFASLTDVVESLLGQLEIDSYSLYLMDYGAPIGFRLATRYPERVESLIIQNGNAYTEGLREFWDPIRAYWDEPSAEHREALRGLLTIEATKWQYTHGVRDTEAISPDNWHIDQQYLDRRGNQAIQLALFYDYRTNVPLYPVWQEYLRTRQPPVLLTWGAEDEIFPAQGAHPYRRDLPEIEFHLLDTGHFALEEDGDVIASLMLSFLDRHVGSAASTTDKQITERIGR